MLTILLLQLLSFCISAMLLKSTDSQGQMSKYEAMMSLHHVLLLSDSLQHVFIPLMQLVPRSWRGNVSHVILWAVTWLFSYISPSWGLQCQVERYLHKYSCYFSAQTVIYKFSRLLNSTSGELTQPAAVNAEWRLWQRRECDCRIVIKHLLQLSMKWGGEFCKKK